MINASVASDETLALPLENHKFITGGSRWWGAPGAHPPNGRGPMFFLFPKR